MKGTRALHLLQLPADLCHTVADQPPVGLDLRFARTAKETKTTPLALKVRPAAHETARLVVEMREFHLQPPLRSDGTLTENLENKARPVDHFRADFFLKVLLLDRRQRRIDDEEASAVRLCLFGNFLHLPLAKQGRRPGRTNPERPGGHDVDPDCSGETFGFIEASLGRSPGSFPRQLWNGDYRPLPASDFDRAIAVKRIQEPSSSPAVSAPCSPPRLRGRAG
jgi:hypothetical protein